MRWWLAVWLLAGCADIQPAGDPDAAGPRDDAAGTRDAAAGPRDAAPDAAGEVTTVFDENSIADTYIQLVNPTLNYGGRERLCGDSAGDDRTILLRIDVSQIPPGSQVIDAELHIWTGASTNDLSPQEYGLHEVLEAWNEGNQAGATGEASWDDRQPGVAWEAAGAGVGSRATPLVGAFTPVALDSEYVTAIDLELVGRWVDSGVSNYGVAIVTSGADGACFNSSEGLTGSKRPRLRVTWIAD